MDNSPAIAAPSLSRRQLLNFLTGTTVAVTASAGLYAVGKSLVPPALEKNPGGLGHLFIKDKWQ